MSGNDRYYNKALKAIILVFTFSIAQMSYGQTLNYYIYFKVGICEIDKEYKGNAQILNWGKSPRLRLKASALLKGLHYLIKSYQSKEQEVLKPTYLKGILK